MKLFILTQKRIKSFSSPPKMQIFGLIAFFIACLQFWALGQCYPPLTVTGPDTARWVAPATGGPWLVQISATGAGGGSKTGQTGGSGATLSGTFSIANGATLLAIVGGAGEGSGDSDGGAGGGGSGVVNCGTSGVAGCPTGTILLIAAGGNGAQGSTNGLGGSSATGGTGNGGAGGTGTPPSATGGGGGGALNSPGTNGGDPNTGDGTTSGVGGSLVSKTNISVGGDGVGGGGDPDGGNGMGAGGGGGSDSNTGGGGGGGHTGGAGGNTASATSFIDVSGTLASSTNGTTGGGSNAGSVTIMCLGPASLQGQCNNTTVINLSGGPAVQGWKAPSTGGPWSVQITAKGGGGGDSENSNQGGGGATITSTFTVQNGQVLFAIAGGTGESSTTDAGGGGGGSGVVNCGTSANCSGGTVMIIAAGGNGAESDGDGQGGLDDAGDGSGGNSGGGSSDGGGGGGSNAAGGGTTGRGGGQVSKVGLSTGGDGTGNSNATDPDGGNGMGGGGGGGSSTSSGSGGGGGHEGGDAGNSATAANRPRSFNSGTLDSSSDGAQGAGPSAGTITIVCLQSLPVELINFKAVIRENQTVDLLWATATEKNNHGYDVERSADNKNWKTLGFVPGNGTTAERHDYTFTDTEPLKGVNYYRLKQLDFDGKHEYSPMVVADVRGGGLQFDVFPNPTVDGELSFRIVSESEGDAEMEIFDWVGYKVYRESVQLLKGTMVYPVSLATFPKGTYTARLQMPDGQVYFKKIVLQ